MIYGKVIKTKNAIDELKRQVEMDILLRIDTHGEVKNYIKLPFLNLASLIEFKDVIFFSVKSIVALIGGAA